MSERDDSPRTAVELRDVTRTFVSTRRGRRTVITALNGVSFEVRAAEIFALVGPNGAGKTTTVRILTTLLAPTTGQASVLGHDVTREFARIRPRINFVYGGDRGLYGRLTAREILTYFSDLYRVPPAVQRARIPELLDLVGLAERADERVETYSRGMRQRLHLARGLVNNPEVLFLDEPTLGLDPVGAMELRNLVRRFAAELGKTVFLTTHYMFEAETLCDRVAVLTRGRIVALDTPARLRQSAAPFSVVEFEAPGLPAEVLAQVRALSGVAHVTADTLGLVQIVRVHVTDPAAVPPALEELLRSAGVRTRLTVRESTLEDAYVQLVGGAKR